MANPDQKTIFYEEAFEELNHICIDYQKNCGATDDDVRKLQEKFQPNGKKLKL